MDEELTAFLAEYYNPKPKQTDRQPASNIYEEQRLFCKTLALVRLRVPITQHQLAEKIGTSQSTLARIEAGRGNPGILIVLKICGALGLELKPQRRDP